MKEINGKPQTVKATDEAVFNFLSDFRHFEKLMPDQISGWQAEENHCSFTVPGMGPFALGIREKIPFSSISIVPDSKSGAPVKFELRAGISRLDDQASTVCFTIIHELPVMIEMMASRPLKNLTDVLAQKLSEYFAQNG